MQQGRGLAPGTIVTGDWHIERMLGLGGFGVTYEARNRRSGAHAALKEYMPSGLCTRLDGSSRITAALGLAGDVFKRGLASFMKEAETLARLDRSSIVRVSGNFEANGTAYMALAFEQGGTLSEWLKRLGRTPTQEELDRLLWPLIDALIQVHSLPLLHRDIKPDNIMLRADGTPVLIDFGAVKNLVSSDSRSINGPATLNFVTDGYAPPEQYVSEGDGLLGPWTDVYALGATICEAITGTKPPSATRRMVDESHRSLAAMPSDHIGSGWRLSFLAGVDRAMSLKRADRPQSMVEFRRAIGLVEAPRSALPPQTRSATEATTQSASHASAAPADRPITFSQVPGNPIPLEERRSKTALGIAVGLAALVLAFGMWWLTQGKASRIEPVALKVETDQRIAEANAGRLKAEAEVRRLADKKAASDAGFTVNAEEAESERQRVAVLKAEAEVRRLADKKTAFDAGKVNAAEAERQRLAVLKAEAELRRLAHEKATASAAAEAEARRISAEEIKAVEEARRIPITALVPGSGQSGRDRLANGGGCAFCPEMVVVPAGKFTMGSPESEPGRYNGEGQVVVSVSRPFAIAKFAVTFDEWDACLTAGGCNGYKPSDAGWGRGTRPVIYVNWYDAKAYAEWLTRLTGKAYRLPSEAEREYAARAGTTTPFWWGNTLTPTQANYDGSVAPYQGGGLIGEFRRKTLPVESFQPNPWGLYQVHGNVWEWTEDCWSDLLTGNPGNGEARTKECSNASRRVVRGGSWFYNPKYLRSAARRHNQAGIDRDFNLGFRLARTLDP